MSSIRVRFAPSPTGHLHIGSLRVALFNWLFAHHHKGIFTIRIEDTDIARSHESFTISLLDSLQWVKITSDEPIVYQSQRMELYKNAIDTLLESGYAYRCYCPPHDETIGSDYLRYDGRCRTFNEQKDEPYVVRFKLPLDLDIITFNDLIRGPIVFELSQFDDFIICRSDGTPVYNFVVVIDDAAMKISHIIRGEDHISNTPKQILLYQAFGFRLPEFAHLPLILGASGGKLSKRDAATNVQEYRIKGYLPDALCNYLVRLGWAHGDQEIFTRDELIALFSLDGVNKSAATFDQAKLDWMNGVYIKNADISDLVAYIRNTIDPMFAHGYPAWLKEHLYQAIALLQDRVLTLIMLIDELNNLAQRPKFSDDELLCSSEVNIQELLSAFKNELAQQANYDEESVKKIIKSLAAQQKLKFSECAQLVRLALTGTSQGPNIFSVVVILGFEESAHRIDAFLNALHKKRSVMGII